MLTAALVLFSAQHSSAVEMLDAFARQSANMEIRLSVTADGQTTPLIWQIEDGQYQILESGELPNSERFVQLPAGMIAITDAYRQYFEFGPYPYLAPLPAELEQLRAIYPQGLLNLAKNRKSVGATEETTLIAKVTEQVMDTTVETRYHFDSLGTLVSFNSKPVGDPMGYEITYRVEGIKFGYQGLSRTRFQPPIGYTPGEIPMVQRPAMSGERLKLGRWGNIDVRALNRKGIVVVFTAPDCMPSNAAAPALNRLAQELSKKNVQMIEVWLGPSKLPKRNWPVVADGRREIEGIFEPPVTPYLVALDRGGTVLGAWAGYAPDQESAMISSIKGRYDQATR